MRRKHIESLDVVRGLAALAVVLHHWGTFYEGPGGGPVDYQTIQLPLGRVSMLFTHYGYLAVDLFFCLSGFIFAHLYGAAIETGRVRAREFAVLRFSRLYPLHFVTLLIICVEQAIYTQRYGVGVGQSNDVFHFLTQLAFISDWWPGSPLTFNGPIWSVSIEVLLYIIFFAIACAGLLRIGFAVPAVLLGFVFLSPYRTTPSLWPDDDLGRGVSMFYMGVLACFLVDAIKAGKVPRSLISALVGIAVLGLIIMKGTGSRGYLGWFLMVFAFPGLIVILVCAEDRIERYVHPFRWIGNISYSTYLLHAPIFFCAILLGLASYRTSPLFLIAMLAVVIAASLASFHFFELPAQHFLRRTLLTVRPAQPKLSNIGAS